MGAPGKSEHLTGFTEADGEFLILIVKLAQHRKIAGAHGQWPDYLRRIVEKRKFKGGLIVNDPAKRPWHVLAGFVASFVEDKDIQIVKRVRKWRRRATAPKKIIWPASPEQHLVELTQEHPSYKKSYSFPSYLEEWIFINHGKGSDASTPERMFSLDCEMGIGEDNAQHVLKLCMVDRDCNIVIDTLVKPEVRIKDYLTSITGVTAADLQKCEFSRADAQRRLQELLTRGAILVGHSLDHDLGVLRVDYQRVIDTALVFKGRNQRKIGLNDLCKAVLGYSFREEGKAHDCLLDAIIPMRLVLDALKNGLHPLELPEQPEVERSMAPSLLLHKLPTNNASPSILRCLFPSNIPCIVKRIPQTRKAYAEFQSVEDAELAFDHVKGVLGHDSGGLQQKDVLVMGREICIRKVRVPKAADEMASSEKVCGGVANSEKNETEGRKRSAEDRERGESDAKELPPSKKLKIGK